MAAGDATDETRGKGLVGMTGRQETAGDGREATWVSTSGARDLLSTRLAQGGRAELVDIDHGEVIALRDGVVECADYPFASHDDIAARALCGVPLTGCQCEWGRTYTAVPPLEDGSGTRRWLVDPSPGTVAREVLVRNARALDGADRALGAGDVLAEVGRARDGGSLAVAVWSHREDGREALVLDGHCPDSGVRDDVLADNLAQALGLDAGQVACVRHHDGGIARDGGVDAAVPSVGPVGGLTAGLRDWMDERLLGDCTLSDGELAVGRAFLDGFEAAMDRLTGAVPERGQEDKRLFCELVSAALVACGDGRYDDLTREGSAYDDRAISYVSTGDGTAEFVMAGPWAMDVTGDSLTALGRDVLELASGSSERLMSANVIRDWVRGTDAGPQSHAEGGHRR